VWWRFPGRGERPSGGLVGAFLAGRVDIHIDVGTERQSDSPQGHRSVRIERRGALEATDGLVVVERVDERQALVKKLLRLGVAGSDGMMMTAESRERGRARRFSRIVQMLRVGGATECESENEPSTGH